jgi:hypothetical protein
MAQADLHRFFNPKSAKRPRDDTDAASVVKVEADSALLAVKEASSLALSASLYETDCIPSPDLAEIAAICDAYRQADTLHKFSETLKSVQPDFSGRISGLERALQWSGAPCTEAKFIYK